MAGIITYPLGDQHECNQCHLASNQLWKPDLAVDRRVIEVEICRACIAAANAAFGENGDG